VGGVRNPLDIECPLCKPEPGQRCVGKTGRERLSFHRARGTRRKAPHPVYHKATENAESPIEMSLASAIMEWVAHHEVPATVSQQAAIGPFRADILIEQGGRRLVVECDGSEFHSITKEQVERDKRRDRYCAARGVCVMRFSGAEIHRDPRGCAAEVGLWIKLR
jgi:very-short-patch-repair endonuclease